MNIRLAEPSDSAGILAIYAPYIRDTSLTFELEVPNETDFGRRIEAYQHNWPWLLAEENGKIAGYAYATRHRERAGYQWSVECSIYMADEFQGKGSADRLYKTLLHLLKMQGFRNVYAVINLPNDRSVAFHERLGFQYKFTFENVGYKLGRWKNVGWWMLQLNPYDENPGTPISFDQLCQQEDIETVLNKLNS